MKRKIQILMAIMPLFFCAKAQDTTEILPPIIGMEESFKMECRRFASVKCKEITYVSTLSSSTGFTPITSVIINPDTAVNYYTEIVKNGLPQITIATNFWVRKELIAMDDITVLATSNVATVTVQPKPLQPILTFASTPLNDGKVYVNLNVGLNVIGKLQAFTVFNAVDTLGGIARKSWYLNPQVKSFVDSSYQTTVGVWVKYQLTDTIKPELTTSTPWVYVSAFIPPSSPEVGIDQIEDSTTMIIKIKGWCITKNLETRVRLVFASGDTSQTIVIPKSNGLSYWSIIDQNRQPNTTYHIVAIAINEKGIVKSSTTSHTTRSTPKKLDITSFEVISRNGGEVSIGLGYSVPSDVIATAIIDYDEDSTFTFPEDWRNFSNLMNSGNTIVSFTGLAPGTYWARIQINDGTSWITKKIQFQIWALSVDEKASSKIISVYPNPCKDVLNVPSTGQWIISNSMGQVIQIGTSSKIDVSNLLPGIYTIKTEHGSTRFVKN